MAEDQGYVALTEGVYYILLALHTYGYGVRVRGQTRG